MIEITGICDCLCVFDLNDAKLNKDKTRKICDECHSKNNKMKKYQKIPIVIEAIQLTEKNIFEVYTEIYSKPNLDIQIASDKWDEYENGVIDNGLKLKTPESDGETQVASIGDWIVFGCSEELGRHCWPVKPDYFKAAYQPFK
tara:strand:+ start:68 stop:496 length:429 start_codon:yes stop_codon:yes gene_type:complete